MDLFGQGAGGRGNGGRKGAAPRGLACAGGALGDDLELKKLAVFVRIRPSVTEGAPRWDAENCIHASSRASIAIAPPEGSAAYKSGDRGQTYSFTRVYDEHTSQEDYFQGTAAPLVREHAGGSGTLYLTTTTVVPRDGHRKG